MGQDCIRQITDILSQYNNLSAIHVISHGAPGQVILGTATLSQSSLNEHANELAAWGLSLSEQGDILLYGCSVGAGPEGEALIQGLAGLTGADVAASNDPTGPAELGGNWVLEVTTGPIEASVADAEAVVLTHGLLAAGDLDPTFGTGGIVTTSLSGYDSYARAMAIQPDGKIVVAGQYYGGESRTDFGVVRYLGDMPTLPEITVVGNGATIANGDMTPGTATLTLGAVSVPAGYTVTEGLSSSLVPGASDTFTVRLDTATAGTKSGEISFSTNDSDENPFHFAITGTVSAAGGNLALGKTAVASTSFPGYATPNLTDGNPSSFWSSNFTDNQWVYVDLGTAATIQRVVLNWQTAYGSSYQLQVSNDAATWTDVCSTTTGDGGRGRPHAEHARQRAVRADAGPRAGHGVGLRPV